MTVNSSLEPTKTHVDINTLWLKFKNDGSIQARNKIFEHYFPWCRDIARKLFIRYSHYLINWDDFVSIISLSTLECIETYDINFGVPFEGYAYTRVKGRLLNEINNNIKHNKQYDQQYIYKDNRNDQEDMIEGDSFTFIVDLVIEMAFEKLLEIGALESNQPDHHYEKEKTALRIMELVDKLDEQEKFIIKSYYFQQISFKNIAGLMDVTSARISQLHKSGLLALREMYELTY